MSNANLALLGLQSMHLQRHARNPNAHAAYLRRRQKIFGYAAPMNSNHLARQLSDVIQPYSAAGASSTSCDSGNESDSADDADHTRSADGRARLSFVHDRRMTFIDQSHSQSKWLQSESFDETADLQLIAA